MSETMQEPVKENIKPRGLAEQGVGSLAVQEALDQRRQAILKKLQRDNADAAM